MNKGEVFSTPVLQVLGEDIASSKIVNERKIDSMHIPKGKWRDGIFSCFEDPLLFLSCCFPHGKKSMNIRI